MKSLFLLALFSVSAQAADCVGDIHKIYHWNDLDESEQACALAHPKFQSGVKVLCNADRSDFSDKYKNYLSYNERYRDLSQKIREAAEGDARDEMSTELSDLTMDWLVAGYRSETTAAWLDMVRARASCENTKQ